MHPPPRTRVEDWMVEVDGNGAAVGIVTRADIVAALMSLYDADEDTGAWEIRAREID